jgi:hypothetical protein
MREAADLMGVVSVELNETRQVFQSMVNKPITEKLAKVYFQAVYPGPEADAQGNKPKRASSIHNRRMETLAGIFERGSGADLKTTHGTLFGAFNAVTDYVDHYGRKSEPSTRMESVLTGHGDAVKRRALRLATDMLV